MDDSRDVKPAADAANVNRSIRVALCRQGAAHGHIVNAMSDTVQEFVILLLIFSLIPIAIFKVHTDSAAAQCPHEIIW